VACEQRREDPPGAEGGPSAGGRRDGYRDAVLDQSDHVVQRNDGQQRVDEVAVRAGLADRHHGRGRRGGRGQRGQHDGERKVQMQNPECQHKDEHRCETGFQHRDDNDLSAVLFQNRDLEKFSGAERDKSQRDIGEKIRAAYDLLRHEMQAPGADQNAGEDVRGHVRQPQQLGQPRHEKSEREHERHGDDDAGDRRRGAERFKEMTQNESLLSADFW